jgi:hypothetical protein
MTPNGPSRFPGTPRQAPEYSHLRDVPKTCYKNSAQLFDKKGVDDGPQALQGAGLQEVVNPNNKSVQAAERVRAAKKIMKRWSGNDEPP